MSEASRPKPPKPSAAPGLGRSGGSSDDTHDGRAIEAIHVSRYVADICSELVGMTKAAELNMLSYYLAMAQHEAERTARAGVAADRAS